MGGGGHVCVCVCACVMCAYFIQVQTVVADVKGRGQKEWHLTPFVGKPLPVCAGGLLQMVELAHRFMCMTDVSTS